MADVSILKVGANSYDIKDAIARTNASNANTKIDGAYVSGTYTAGTETLELSITPGTIQ